MILHLVVFVCATLWLFCISLQSFHWLSTEKTVSSAEVLILASQLPTLLGLPSGASRGGHQKWPIRFQGGLAPLAPPLPERVFDILICGEFCHKALGILSVHFFHFVAEFVSFVLFIQEVSLRSRCFFAREI